MTLLHLLFSSYGRIGRKTYWLYILAVVGLTILLDLLDPAFGTYDEETGIGVFSTLFNLLTLVTDIFVAIKRCHDVNHSGWFMLLQWIPLLGLWATCVLLFSGGTHGINEYGPDPRLSMQLNPS